MSPLLTRPCSSTDDQGLVSFDQNRRERAGAAVHQIRMTNRQPLCARHSGRLPRGGADSSPLLYLQDVIYPCELFPGLPREQPLNVLRGRILHEFIII